VANVGAAAYPSRDLAPARPEWRSHSIYGGQRGSIALPSRLAVDGGEGIPNIQMPDPAAPHPFPAVRYLRGWTGPCVQAGGALPLGLWGGALTTQYVRQYHPNVYTAAHRIAPVEARTNWSTNRNGAADTAGPELPATAPVAFDWRHVVQTFSQEFDTRCQADYVPHERPQKSLIPSRFMAGYDAPAMLVPYFPRLTVWQQPGSYGQGTEVLTPTPAGG